VLARARLLRRLGRDEEALSAFARAIELEPPSFAVWSEYGKYLAELDRAAEARPWLTRALELPSPPEWDAELVRTARESILRALEGLGMQAPDEGG
jgi:Tfp pilus assembly protein PilF